jgi:tetratricopeptide (TPR) repeat protein
MTSEEYYLEGNEHRKQGDFGKAMCCYMEAIRLDADSPAVAAKEMLEDIMNFYCKDYYNP